ncbi:MAG: hypothetical protein IJZ36_03930 [Bacilli bacterium]|nr:hypothetical protein [Bacilli bacterium]
MKIYDVSRLPFGSRITIKAIDGVVEKAVVIANAIAFTDGILMEFSDVMNMEVYLGWL